MENYSDDEEEFSRCCVLREAGDDNLCEPYRKSFFYEDLAHCISPCFTNTLRFCEKAMLNLSRSMNEQPCSRRRERPKLPAGASCRDVGRIVEVVDECLSCQKFEVPPLEKASHDTVSRSVDVEVYTSEPLPPKPVEDELKLMVMNSEVVKSGCDEGSEAGCSKVTSGEGKDRERCKNININVRVKIQKKRRDKPADRCERKEITKCRCKHKRDAEEMRDSQDQPNIRVVPCESAAKSRPDFFELFKPKIMGAPQFAEMIRKCKCKQRRKSSDSSNGDKLPAILEQNVKEGTKSEEASRESDMDKIPRKDESRKKNGSITEKSRSKSESTEKQSMNKSNSNRSKKKLTEENLNQEQRKSLVKGEEKSSSKRRTSSSMVPIFLNEDIATQSIHASTNSKIVQYLFVEHSLSYSCFSVNRNEKIYSVRKMNVKSKFFYTETQTRVFGKRAFGAEGTRPGRVKEEIQLSKGRSDSHCQQLYDLREIFKKFEVHKQEQFVAEYAKLRRIRYRKIKKEHQYVFSLGSKMVWGKQNSIILKIIAVHLIFFIYFVIFVWVTFFY